MKSQQRQSFLDHIEAKAQAQPPVACWSEQHCAGNKKSWLQRSADDGSQLEITTIRNECIQVCLTEDGFTECCFVSSMHLAPGGQLRKVIPAGH